MAVLTGTGAIVLPALTLSGVGEILTPDPGPIDTRQSTINIDLSMKGNYFDELVDGEKNDVFNWKADGFKYVDRPGDGTAAKGQSNRFWYKKSLEIQYNQHVDLDLYSYLAVDAGKGVGQDGLGLGIVTHAITFLLIRNRLNGSNLTIGGADFAPWESLLSGTMILPPGNFAIWQTRNMDAWDVSQGTSQYLRLACSGNPITADVYIAGRFHLPT